MGKTNRLINRVLIGAWFMSAFLFLISNHSSEGFSLHYIFIIVWLIFLVFIILFLSYTRKVLFKGGNIKITRQYISKSIGELSQIYHYNEIGNISIEKHLSSGFISKSNDGAKTYLVTLSSINGLTDRFIVSAQSTDKPYVNFVQAVKKANEITGNLVLIDA